MIVALCTFLALLAAPSLEQDSQVPRPPSPCSNVFMYDPPGPEPGWWSGVVNVSTDYLLHSLWLDIMLDSQALELQHRTAEVTTQNFKSFRIEMEDLQIHPGFPISLPFLVKYDWNDEAPRLQGIGLNGKVICKAITLQSIAGQTESSILRLETYTNNKKPVINSPIQSFHSVDPRPDGRPAPGINSNTEADFSDQRGFKPGQTQCGTSTLANQWPWVVAVYLNNNVNYEFRCVGSLLSNRHVITAAQCVHTQPPSLTQTVIHESSMMVHLGKHNLRTFVLGVQIRFVQKIIVVPDYNQTHFFDQWQLSNDWHDVALLELQEPVTYTDWVRPVCLWPSNAVDLDSVVGKKGWLVGWSFDDKNVVAEQLTAVEVPVVSQETCIKSNVNFFGNVMTETSNSYCAGNREDTILCEGHTPGSAMFYRMGNSWYLRGQNSLVLFRKLQTVLLCDPTQYMVFSDVAKYVPWIHQVISDNV